MTTSASSDLIVYRWEKLRSEKMKQLPTDEFLLENLLGNMSDVIYFKDLKSNFIMVNQACADRHNRGSAESLKGTSDFDTFSKVHAEQAYADEQRIIQTGEPLDAIEEEETWPDGSSTWASTIKMPLQDDAGTIIGTFGISRDITARKTAELRASDYANQILAGKEEMEEEVRLAGRLQKNFCPASYPEFPEGVSPEESCVDFLYSFNLTSQVTGDYCAIKRLSATEVGLFICDVCGKGIRAALGTALIRGIMQEISSFEQEPEAYLSRMNELLIPLLRKKELMLDVTACYMVVNVQTGAIRLANAGHPWPILFRDTFSAEWLCEEVEAVGPPLATEDNPGYVAVECSMQPNDAVVMFTDGLCSSENNAGNLYGKKRLLDSAQSFSGEPLAEIFQGLEADALAFSRDGKFADDICLVGLSLRKRMD